MEQIRPLRKRSLRSPPARRVLGLVGDSQVGLWVVRGLGCRGLTFYCVCASRHGLAAHSRYSSGAWVLESPAFSSAFAEEVGELARRLDVGSIMTIAEGFHSALIRHRQHFEPDIHVFSPSAESFAKATDKDFMHALCLRLGVPVARGLTLDKLMDAGDDLRYPLVLRTRRQNDPRAGGKAPWKAAYAETPEQLERLYRSVEAFADNILVQEYHPGMADHVQILMHRGEAFMAGEYIGEDHMPLAGGVTVMRVSCRHDDLVRDAARLLKGLNWEGIAGVQFHYDPETERHIFLEINPRFIGGLPTVIMAGFDAPFLLWQSHFEPEKMRKTPYQLGLRTRILGGHANWMFGTIRGDQLPPGQKRQSKVRAISRFLWHCGPWTKDDTFWLGDLKPSLVDWKMMIRRLGADSLDIIGNPRSQENPR